MNRFYGTAFIIVALVSLFGCKPDPVFPAEPALSFKEYQQPQSSDTLQVVFNFTDGDGDIGVSVTDTTKNMLLTVYHRDPATGAWGPLMYQVNSTSWDSLQYKYRIPHLTAGQSGLEGEIYLTINRQLLRLNEDTVQFNAVLIDNSRHKSPYVRTPEVVLLP